MYKIKQIPEDFMVSERNSFKFKEEGEFTYFWLKKKNWTSIKAIQEIAKRLNININRFNIAGNKDKNAVTRQLFSVSNLDEKRLKGIKIKDLEIRYAGRRDERLKLGDLDFNEFKIVVRNLDSEKNFEVKYLPNYFDDQRFGGVERPNTHLVGKLLIKKEYEEAMKVLLGCASESETDEHKKLRNFVDKNWGKWKEIDEKFPGYLLYEKKALQHLRVHNKDYVGAFRTLPRKILLLFIHAYQSYLWNCVLARYLDSKAEGRWVDYSAGKLFFPKDYYEDKEIPIFGFLTKLGGDEIGEIYKTLLEEEGIEKKDFINRQISLLSSEGDEREAFMEVFDFSCEFENDELNKKKKKVILNFKLKSGSYATLVVKSLFG